MKKDSKNEAIDFVQIDKSFEIFEMAFYIITTQWEITHRSVAFFSEWRD